VLRHLESDDWYCNVFCCLSVVKYQLEVYTGSVEHASTAASVCIKICADDGDTGRRTLKKSLNNRVKFAVGQVSLVSFLHRILFLDVLASFR